MANITRFSLPLCVEVELTDNYDLDKIVNAVQSELNMGVQRKIGASSKAEFKTVKEDGEQVTFIDVKTKQNETLRLQNTTGARFYGWCLKQSELQQFATTDVSIPDCFVKWLDKFAKKEVKPVTENKQS